MPPAYAGDAAAANVRFGTGALRGGLCCGAVDVVLALGEAGGVCGTDDICLIAGGWLFALGGAAGCECW